MPRRCSSFAFVLCLAFAAACAGGPPDSGAAGGDVVAAASAAPLADTAPSVTPVVNANEATSAPAVPAAADTNSPSSTGSSLPPNELGRIPVLEYHLLGDSNSTYTRTRSGLRRDLELLYERGYRPVSVSELVDRKLDLPAGLSPVVMVFDDASPSQFGYIEADDGLEVDPESAVGILLAFNRAHADWRNRAVFCLLSGAEAGRSFFGNKGIEGQKTEWRFSKVQRLHAEGFELCNHTLWHANLRRYPDSTVQEQIARGQLAIDSAVPGYRVRTFALPLGQWPVNRALAYSGEWRSPKGDIVVRYDYSAVLEVAGGPSRSPYDPAFNPRSIPRVQVIGDSAVARTLNQLERAGQRYVSDGDPSRVAQPPARVAKQPIVAP
jgi:hypothetical protein